VRQPVRFRTNAIRSVSWRERFQIVLDRIFPEREFIVRTEGRVAHLRVSQRAQFTAAVFLVGFASWGGFASVNFLYHAQIVAFKDDQIATARLAYRTLLGEIAEYQKKFNAITREIDEHNAFSSTLRDQNAQLQKSISTVESQLLATEKEREQMAQAREKLRTQLAEIENNMQSLASRNFTLKGNLNHAEKDLQTALAERNQALFESTHLRRQMRETESRLAAIRESQLESVRQLAERTSGFIESTEKVLHIAGIDANQLLATPDAKKRNKEQGGKGGPFIPFKSSLATGDDESDPIASEMETLSRQLVRWESLQGAMQRVPLAAPLANYAINSPFGKRMDPINGMWSAHYGVDLGAPKSSPVHAPALGVVVVAGYQDKYGLLIEIDHGHGLRTRYGHLSKAMVKKGDKIAFNQVIGLVGNSGRSTGTHLHYEILFKDKPKNPINFIKAGRHVFKE
jgi:murein DD-endopeptidase MepM/ murein hydrolase activator NlpD